MTTLKVLIQSLEDAKNGVPAIPGITHPEQTTSYPCVSAVIMEGGMQSGATSIMLVLQKDPTDRAHLGEISGKLLETLYSAYKGAQARWNQPVEGP